METTFDFSQLNDRNLKRLYEYIPSRCNEVIESFRAAYGKTSDYYQVSFQFVLSDHLNAEAGRQKDQYAVAIHTPTILLLRTLFESLLSFNYIIPEIGTGIAPDATDLRELPFILNLSQPATFQNVPITTDTRRQFAASMLADFCSSFILLHEVGHVILGHTESADHYFGRPITEFASWQDVGQKGQYLRQSYEYDADAVAGKLLVQYIADFIRVIETRPDYTAIFGPLAKDGYLIERVTALIIMSLYVMFTYMAQAAKKLNKFASHPHPLHRSFYSKDIILKAMEQQGPIDIKRTLKFNQYYFDRFSDALQSLKLVPYPTMTSALTRDISKQTRLIGDRASKLRVFSEEWSWLPREDWG